MGYPKVTVFRYDDSLLLIGDRGDVCVSRCVAILKFECMDAVETGVLKNPFELPRKLCINEEHGSRSRDAQHGPKPCRQCAILNGRE